MCLVVKQRENIIIRLDILAVIVTEDFKGLLDKNEVSVFMVFAHLIVQSRRICSSRRNRIPADV